MPDEQAETSHSAPSGIRFKGLGCVVFLGLGEFFFP